MPDIIKSTGETTQWETEALVETLAEQIRHQGRRGFQSRRDQLVNWVESAPGHDPRAAALMADALADIAVLPDYLAALTRERLAEALLDEAAEETEHIIDGEVVLVEEDTLEDADD